MVLAGVFDHLIPQEVNQIHQIRNFVIFPQAAHGLSIAFFHNQAGLIERVYRRLPGRTKTTF